MERTVCLFAVGDGAVERGDWFNPLPASPLDTTLAHPLPFRRVLKSEFESSVESVNLTSVDRANYFMANPVTSSGTEYVDFYAKRFNNVKPLTYVDIDDNRVFKLLELEISSKDCRIRGDGGDMINELSLLLARPDRLLPDLLL